MEARIKDEGKKSKKRKDVEEEPQEEEIPDEEEGDEEEEDQYEVERILNHKKTKAGMEYFVHWKGYGDEDDSWVPAENMACPDLVDAYWDKRSKGGKTKKAKATNKSAREESVSTRRTSSPEGINPPRKAKSGVRANYAVDLEEQTSRKKQKKKSTQPMPDRPDSAFARDMEALKRQYEGVDPSSLYLKMKGEPPEEEEEELQQPQHEEELAERAERPTEPRNDEDELPQERAPSPETYIRIKQEEAEQRIRERYEQERAQYEQEKAKNEQEKAKIQKEKEELTRQMEAMRAEMAKLKKEKEQNEKKSKKGDVPDKPPSPKKKKVEEAVPPLRIKLKGFQRQNDRELARMVEEASRPGPSRPRSPPCQKSPPKTKPSIRFVLSSSRESEKKTAKTAPCPPPATAVAVDTGSSGSQKEASQMSRMIEQLKVSLDETRQQAADKLKRLVEEEANLSESDLLELEDEEFVENVVEDSEELREKIREETRKRAEQNAHTMDPWQRGFMAEKIQMMYDIPSGPENKRKRFVVAKFSHPQVKERCTFAVEPALMRRRQPELLSKYGAKMVAFIKMRGLGKNTMPNDLLKIDGFEKYMEAGPEPENKDKEPSAELNRSFDKKRKKFLISQVL